MLDSGSVAQKHTPGYRRSEKDSDIAVKRCTRHFCFKFEAALSV